MLEKPDLLDEAITDCLIQAYRIQTTDLTFLPIGYDARSWVYVVDAEDGFRCFLKLRKGPLYAAGLTVPRHLYEQSIIQVVAPLHTQSLALWAESGEYSLVCYPFIDGVTAAEVGLSDKQWREFGALLAAIHGAALPATLLDQVARETFVPPWSQMVRTLQSLIDRGDHEGPIGREFVGYWKTRQAEISRLVERTEELGRQLASQAPDPVLCHADIHTHNVLVDDQSHLHVVDWDGVILAPKERDLMFVVGDVGKGHGRTRSEQMFFEGYGETAVDPLALAYYRYEWVVQEIGDCGERVLLTPETGESTKRAAVQDFIELFQPGDVVEGAYLADAAIGT